MQQPSKTEQLRCESLELRVGYRSLIRNFSMSIHSGESSAVVGPNGLGKTTLLRALCGIGRPYRGNVFLNGKMLWPEKSDDMQADLCFLASQPALFADHSVLSNFEFYMRSMGRSFTNSDMLHALKEFDLASNSAQTARTLSTGQKRRLTLAFVKLAQPKLLFLDEPTNGLDTNGVELCLATLQAVREQGCGLVIASHDQKLVNWCEHRIELKEWIP